MTVSRQSTSVRDGIFPGEGPAGDELGDRSLSGGIGEGVEGEVPVLAELPVWQHRREDDAPVGRGPVEDPTHRRCQD